MRASQLPTARREGTAPTSGAAGSPAAPDDGSGLVLQRYRLVHRLGAGAFGVVWRAHDQRLDREVAVKIVPRELVFQGRFEREARAAARLTHPGIVTLYEAAVDDEGAYLVSELVHGQTLQEMLAGDRLSDRDVVAIALSVCEALAHAHAHGVIHRDVKPSNVLVPERPSSRAHPAKLTDFGVARVVGGDTLTRGGEVIGTAAYMAPEQAEGLPAGAPADLYALALVTYEALTGVNPVRTSTAAMRARRLGAYLPPLRRQRRDLPRELGRAIDLALRPRARERGTLAELHEALAYSLERVVDEPGTVRVPAARAAVPAIGAGAPPAVLGEPADAPDPGGPALEAAGPEPEAHRGPSAPWPARMTSALSAGILTGWLTAHLLPPGWMPAGMAAVVAAVVVLVLPRLGWLTIVVALAGAAAAGGRPVGGLLLLAAALVPALLLPRRGTLWTLPALAPALGLIGLAGVWPAAAARIGGGPWRRAALGASGWLWVALASPIAGRELYPGATTGTHMSLSSLSSAMHHLLLHPGVLAVAAVWALAAAILVPLLRGRWLTADAVLALTWSAATMAASEMALATTVRPGLTPAALLGTVAGVLVALAPGVAVGYRGPRRAPSPRPQLP